jgi:hypothetical protein
MPKLSPNITRLLKRGIPTLPKLNRYTTLPIALDMLAKKRMTLLSPKTWEDWNDAYYLERYRQELKFESVLAICFSMCSETFHHWRIFSHGASGVCIEFDRAMLLQSLKGAAGFRSSKVEYRYIAGTGIKCPSIERWPFMKRNAFKAEEEFRIIYESKEESQFKHVQVDLNAIKKVTLSPWLPEPVVESVVGLIKSIDGCGHLNVNPSSLLNNAIWRNWIEQYAPSAS